MEKVRGWVQSPIRGNNLCKLKSGCLPLRVTRFGNTRHCLSVCLPAVISNNHRAGTWCRIGNLNYGNFWNIFHGQVRAPGHWIFKEKSRKIRWKHFTTFVGFQDILSIEFFSFSTIKQFSKHPVDPFLSLVVAWQTPNRIRIIWKNSTLNRALLQLLRLVNIHLE